MRLRSSLLLLALALPAAACAPTVQQADLTSFAKAADDLGTQANLAFTESNKLARQVSIDRFVASGKPGLAESDFQVAVDPEDVAAWQSAFGNLEAYGTAVASLVDSSRGTKASDALVALGGELSGGQIGARIDPGIAAGFASLAGALVNLKAQHDAHSILQQTDPAVQTLLQRMAGALGAGGRDGLRGTVYSNWTASLNPVRAAYAAAATARNEDEQRSIIAQYLASIDQRDAQLASLGALRSSILSLAAAHAAAAQGQGASFQGLLAAIGQRVDETERLYAAFKAQEPAPQAPATGESKP
jgi:hypothetical protein